MATKKKPRSDDVERVRRSRELSVAEWRELVGDTSNVLTISLPSRGRKKKPAPTASTKPKEK